jgi:hypothetical protein
MRQFHWLLVVVGYLRCHPVVGCPVGVAAVLVEARVVVQVAVWWLGAVDLMHWEMEVGLLMMCLGWVEREVCCCLSCCCLVVVWEVMVVRQGP